jgi:hypothetical protein
MPENRKSLPALNVPVAGYKLVRAFARQEDMSISEAVRQLLKESPRLVEFARQQGLDVGLLDVGSWGGSRDKDEDEIEPPTMRPHLVAMPPRAATRLSPGAVLARAAQARQEDIGENEPHLAPVEE